MKGAWFAFLVQHETLGRTILICDNEDHFTICCDEVTTAGALKMLAAITTVRVLKTCNVCLTNVWVMNGFQVFPRKHNNNQNYYVTMSVRGKKYVQLTETTLSNE